MPEESTTPDLVELTRRSLAAGPKEIDAGTWFLARDGAPHDGEDTQARWGS